MRCGPGFRFPHREEPYAGLPTDMQARIIAVINAAQTEVPRQAACLGAARDLV